VASATRISQRRGHHKCVRELVADGAVLNERDDGGWTALISACHRGCGKCVRELVAVGAALDVRDAYGWTALMYACRWGHSKRVRELVAAGAALNVRDERGWTALVFACHWGHRECVRELVAGGAELYERDWNGLEYDAECVKVLEQAPGVRAVMYGVARVFLMGGRHGAGGAAACVRHVLSSVVFVVPLVAACVRRGRRAVDLAMCERVVLVASADVRRRDGESVDAWRVRRRCLTGGVWCVDEGGRLKRDPDARRSCHGVLGGSIPAVTMC